VTRRVPLRDVPRILSEPPGPGEIKTVALPGSEDRGSYGNREQ